MLDSHSRISGIGEYDGVEIMGTGIASTGMPIRNLSMLPRETGSALQECYLRGAMRLRRDGAQILWSMCDVHCDNSDRNLRFRLNRLGYIGSAYLVRIVFGFHDGQICVGRIKDSVPNFIDLPEQLIIEPPPKKIQRLIVLCDLI